MADSFLSEPTPTARSQVLYDEDLADDGYVWNASRLHAYQPDTMQGLAQLAAEAFEPSGLSPRQKAVLVLAATSTLGDSYCSLGWGANLARAGEPEIAVAVLNGATDGLTDQEVAMARWARQVAGDPNSASAGDVQQLRDAGLDDIQIFAITAFVAIRIAIATVNDALGAHPDQRLADSLPADLVAAVDYGRQPRD
ncbi:carboxymuconolactone decarboxylase family protein [Jatrophihabitans endophyticus]|uniref:carboxymuconolactone decarboxylase family protein n=1 Tax=Jatrophihabitans endophyticus TaxID=1206085 RepID=UPI0019F1B0F7|nr:carboxymuconolactone decarboxylase family protein [Jatrophihabitans endophyticus]MBE7190033.1 carboxymuconolactone decarboxylase family protein [Jatrophihabitans endophyticus]